ncbi:polyprenyl synthetase family protein [Streptomyces sp. NPDC008139]|uniref:polyprenyl synthetase family protein n=1 Tax=Streptomyces sp. NPDC008139 TaxID=3364814 RepID=UPI0036EE7A69
MRRIAADEHPSPGEQAARGAPYDASARVLAPRPPDPAAVDADVADHVGRVLAHELGERVAAAAAIDAVFARDLAERVAGFTLGGGKRTRSQFLWWGLRAAGGGGSAEEVHAALRIAAAVELVQTCALVHDDVMDGSALRRGRPAVHLDLDAQYPCARRSGPAEPFGRAAAVLVGDLALAWADDTVAATALPDDTSRRVRVLWQAMRTEMVAGQYLDLHGQTTGARSAARALRTARLKSALYSVERPLALGAALARADEETTRALCAAGRQAGIAFQLRDDLHGVFGDPAYTGKPTGEDIRDGKPNYLIAVARDRAEAADDRQALALLDTAVGDPRLSDGELDRVRDLLVATGARAAVEHRIEKLAADSARFLAGATRVGPVARARLLDLFQRAAGVRPDGRSVHHAPHPRDRPAAAGPGPREAAAAGDHR